MTNQELRVEDLRFSLQLAHDFFASGEKQLGSETVRKIYSDLVEFFYDKCPNGSEELRELWSLREEFVKLLKLCDPDKSKNTRARKRSLPNFNFSEVGLGCSPTTHAIMNEVIDDNTNSSIEDEEKINRVDLEKIRRINNPNCTVNEDMSKRIGLMSISRDDHAKESNMEDASVQDGTSYNASVPKSFSS